jgi:cytochrome P450
MVTTQEFICLATWQMLEHDALRQEFLRGDQEARNRILHELLRLDPVVAHLLRRAASDLCVPSNGATVTIPRGALIDLHLNEINADARAAGQEPLTLNPQRALDKNVSRSLMGFGAGPHRCVGEFIALAESDIFLQRLMQIESLRIVQAPKIRRNETIKGYELREFILSV